MGNHGSGHGRFRASIELRKACAVMLVAGLVLGPGVASAAIDKNASYQEMLSLAQQMNGLKPQARSNADAAAAYATAEARYRELSSAMGGDDPGHVLGATGRFATRANRTKVVPATPGGCGPVTTNFAQTTPTPIADVAVSSSTILVSGAGPYLFDLDLTTNLTHTFSADMDITLTSPAGTVVTLTTDNGAGNDNVYNGTLWDDDANPAGTVPYTTNNGMVTDHAYVNLTTATPLVPEEAMAAFIGEDPNGTWTLSVSDDLTGDTGSIDSWSLAVTTFPSAPITTASGPFTQATPTPIADVAVSSSTILVAGVPTPLLDVNVLTNITHTFSADMDITLTSPAGTVVTLTTDNGAGNDNVYNGTTWDDDANPAGTVPYTTNNGMVTDHAYVNLTTATPLVAEEALGAFIGEDPNGTWTLSVSDDLTGDTGSIDGWSLNFVSFSCASSDLSITKDDGTATATPGGSTTYTIVASNAGPTAANPATVTDTFPAACTSVNWTSVAAGGASGNTAAGSGNINDTALDLPVGGSVTYTATCSISSAATGSLSNTATVSSGNPDPVAGNNSATDIDSLSGSADLDVTKTLTTVGAIPPGSNATFAITVTNNGPSDATGVVVTDNLPAGLAYVSNDCGASFASPTLTWNVGNLANGASLTCNLTVTVNETSTNTATATANEADPNPTNTPGAADVTITGIIAVPALDTVGLAILALLLAASAALVLRRRRQA